MGQPNTAHVPHKHAELIKAWADGAEIQMYSTFNSRWQEVDPPMWRKDEQYRIKPKTIKYRLYIYKGWASHTIRVGMQEGYESDKSLSEGFIRYLGDWQEVEV